MPHLRQLLLCQIAAVASGSNEQLQISDVDPAVELSADLSKAGDFAKAKTLVQSDARMRLGATTGEQTMVIEPRCALEQIGENRSAVTLPMLVGTHVNRSLCRMPVAGAAPIQGERSTRDDFALFATTITGSRGER
jgi:hypothetical protein